MELWDIKVAYVTTIMHVTSLGYCRVCKLKRTCRALFFFLYKPLQLSPSLWIVWNGFCYYVTTVFVWVHHTPTFDAFILQYNNSETPSTVIDYWSRCCDDSKKKRTMSVILTHKAFLFDAKTLYILFTRLKYYMKIMENLKSLLRAIYFNTC